MAFFIYSLQENYLKLKLVLERDSKREHILVVLVHHPPQKRFNKAIEWMGMLDEKSKQRIQQFCHEFKIHMILNGHTHAPFMGLLPKSDTLCIDCGSTTMQSRTEKSYFNVYQVQGIQVTKGWKYKWDEVHSTFQGDIMELPECPATRNSLNHSSDALTLFCYDLISSSSTHPLIHKHSLMHSSSESFSFIEQSFSSFSIYNSFFDKTYVLDPTELYKVIRYKKTESIVKMVYYIFLFGFYLFSFIRAVIAFDQYN